MLENKNIIRRDNKIIIKNVAALGDAGVIELYSDDEVTKVGEITAAGAGDFTTLKIAGTAITATAAEVNSIVSATVGVVSHDYAGAAADWTLSTAEKKAARIIATNANGAVNAIATPTAGKVYLILNTSGQALTFKAAGQSGVVLASTKSAIVIGNGTDFIRVTADA